MDPNKAQASPFVPSISSALLINSTHFSSASGAIQRSVIQISTCVKIPKLKSFTNWSSMVSAVAKACNLT
ncbi:hypothetical protein WICPIJ_001031 [Wickerhamomyces pijperi]|uniref:Uncharacterized protein n=1 Tax=Wickerhamomyces pijperi TaxID=599730 RepID=A0A9P8QEW3_WICPI|nr:hypothetical protein WICPIJ_001031 [Wickerhamomyces pijperi]